MGDTHIYLDLQIVNNNQNNNDPPPVLTFSETRNSPFLPGDSADYYASILRFSVQTGDEIPVFIPRIEVGETQMDINKTVYKVSVENSRGDVKTVSLIFETWNLNAPVPSPPVLRQDITSRYYYMSNFAQFLPMINKALKDAWEVADTTKDNSPFMDFDTETSKFNICMDMDHVKNGTKLYFNSRLYELLSTFPAKFIGYPGDKNYQLVFTNIRDLNTKPIYKPSENGKCQVVSYNAIQVFQELSTIALWCPVASIVFTTSLLPIKSTNTSPPQVFNDSTVGSNYFRSSGSPNLASIITDFEIPISYLNQYRPDIHFRVESEYRLVDMCSHHNLNQIDITVYWQSIYGEYNALHLPPGCSASMKILFRSENV